VLLAASCDSPADNSLFAQNLELPYPILCDTARQVARAYGVLKGLPFPARHTIYIDPEGRVAFVDQKVSVSNAGQDMLRHLARLGFPRRG
jgi:peroxiredoxin